MVGICEVKLYLPGISSLKGKRRILKGLNNRIRNKFNVSIAELDVHDKWQIAIIGIACINKDRSRIDQVLNHVVGFIESTPDILLTDYTIETI